MARQSEHRSPDPRFPNSLPTPAPTAPQELCLSGPGSGHWRGDEGSRFPARSALAAAFLLLLASACGGDGGGGDPTGPGDDPGDPNTVTGTVDASGGSVLLSDGSGVVFPAGAVSGSLSVTVKKADPTTWFDPNGTAGQAVLTTTASTSQFNAPVQIRVPLPSTATPADSVNVFAGVVDEATGAITAEPSTIQIIEGKPYLVVSSNHFTSRFFEWLLGKQPPSTAMLTVPYYNQGSSPFCWATSLHMVTQATDFEEVRLLTDVIGKAGVDEGGISAVDFRMGSAIADIVRGRTGVRPTRTMWDYVNGNLVKDYLRKEIGVSGHPVAVFSSKWEHAVVVVGYDGSTFFIHDPASTSTGFIGYTAKAWTEFVEGMAVNDKLVTLVVPKALQSREPLAVNFLPQALQFVKPSYGVDDPSAIYGFKWDHTRTEGYAFRHLSSDEAGDPLPGEVTLLKTAGDIQISNASRTASKDVSVYLDVTAMGAPTGMGRLSTQRDVTVGPNSVVNLQVPDIKVDTFRYNVDRTVEYVLTVSALTGGSTVDRQSLVFNLAPVTPEVANVTPVAGAVGETVTLRGTKLGLMALNNAVTFNGTPATQVVSWEDSEVQVVVPQGATTGPVILKRGEVESNPVDFTVSQFTTLTGTATQEFPFSKATLSVTGPWSLRGVGATLAGYMAETEHHILQVALNTTATLGLSFSGGFAPATFVTDQGFTYVFNRLEWRIDTEVTAGTGGNPTLNQTGTGGNQTFEFTPTTRMDKFRATVSVLAYGDIYDPQGKLSSADAKFTERVAAIYTVESK